MRDAIVIGAGGGGAVAAKELAERGLDVLLLEAGPRFAHPERDWSHYQYASNNPLTGVFRFGPANRSRPAWIRELAQSSLLFQSGGVGGTTNAYLANCPRSMPGVFRGYDGADRDGYDVRHRFPFEYRELVPYYEWVEHTLPVQTAAMGLKEQAFFAAASRMGLPVQTGKDVRRAAFRPQENAILQPRGSAGRSDDPRSQRHPYARGCTFAGHCSQGCFDPIGAPINLKAKRATSVSYVPMALTADAWSRAGGKSITLLSDAFAVQIHTDSDCAARAVTWRIGASGELQTEEARVVILAAGAVESPRLWLNSKLPNPNGWVGRGLTDHSGDLVVGVLPESIAATSGAQSAARIDFPGFGALEPVALPPAVAGLLALSDAGIPGYYDNGLPGSEAGADSVGRLIGRDLKGMLAELDRVMVMLILTDDDVEAQNNVGLSTAVPADEHGAVARVEIRHRQRSARTLRNREFLAGQAVRLLRAAGARRGHRVNTPPFIFHPHSSLRMGARASDAVLDGNCEARWVKRLFVADNSALANSVGGVNPTLTTQALATRTAEKIFQLYFGGEPWVAREVPRASTDPQVTRAVLQRGL
jgi:choline dehydrogenase-like flavoprotein